MVCLKVLELSLLFLKFCLCIKAKLQSFKLRLLLTVYTKLKQLFMFDAEV